MAGNPQGLVHQGAAMLLLEPKKRPASAGSSRRGSDTSRRGSDVGVLDVRSTSSAALVNAAREAALEAAEAARAADESLTQDSLVDSYKATICVPPPRRPSTSRRPASAAPSRSKHQTTPPPAPRPESARERGESYLMAELKAAQEERDAAQSAEVRGRLLSFAKSEKQHLEKMALLRRLDKDAKLRKGPEPEEKEMATTSARVVAKVKRFYAELRAERAVLHKEEEGLKNSLREAESRRDLAEKRAAQAEKQSADSKREAERATEKANRAISDVSAALASCSVATTASADEAKHLRAELESSRRELTESHRETHVANKLREMDAQTHTEKQEEQAERSRELAKFGARLQARVSGAEAETERVTDELAFANEKLRRLGALENSNALLVKELARFHHPRSPSPKRPKSAKKSSSKKKRPDSARSSRSHKKSPRRPASASPRAKPLLGGIAQH